MTVIIIVRHGKKCEINAFVLFTFLFIFTQGLISHFIYILRPLFCSKYIKTKCIFKKICIYLASCIIYSNNAMLYLK